MVCIYCGNDTQVINSRLQKRSNATWRRRRCLECKNVFSTIERVDLAQALRIELTGSKLTPFDRDVLFTSIYDSLKHRDHPIQDASELTNTVISTLVKSRQAVFSRQEVIEATLKVLERFDNAASVQYSAFHKVSI